MDFECRRPVLTVAPPSETELAGAGCGTRPNAALCGFPRGDHCFGAIPLGFHHPSMQTTILDSALSSLYVWYPGIRFV